MASQNELNENQMENEIRQLPPVPSIEMGEAPLLAEPARAERKKKKVKKAKELEAELAKVISRIKQDEKRRDILISQIRIARIEEQTAANLLASKAREEIKRKERRKEEFRVKAAKVLNKFGCNICRQRLVLKESQKDTNNEAPYNFKQDGVKLAESVD